MTASPPRSLPLHGIRVIEFTHMIMGPSCGMILGDLGAEVIKIEPLDGDKTRKLIGSGAGFFRMFNRNKKSVAIDIKSTDGKAAIDALIASADVVIENFRPGAMKKSGLDYATLSKRFPKLIYASHKGFLSGPYDHRGALDEVVQMMGGLAYMTGPTGRPLRAGSSVNDIMGGMFAVIGILSALRERDTTGKGQEIQVGLFENCVLLAGQHMQQYAATGQPAAPMPERINAWGVYDVFDTADQQQIFLGVVTDSQWAIFLKAFDVGDIATRTDLATNIDRVRARTWMIPALREVFARHTLDEIQAVFEREGLPYAPIVKPEQLFDDPHLVQGGGLAAYTLDDGSETRVPVLPLSMDGRKFGPRFPLAKLGEHTAAYVDKSKKGT